VLHRAGQPIKCYKRAWNRASKEALRCEDVDLDRLPYGWIRFRAEHDKTGNEQWVPITDSGVRTRPTYYPTVEMALVMQGRNGEQLIDLENRDGGIRVEGAVRRLHTEHRASFARCEPPPATSMT